VPDVNHYDFLILVCAAAGAGLLATTVGARIGVPVVVVEVLAGVLIGPEALGWVAVDPFIEFFSDLGLGMLFFFAGYEIDFERIRGDPLKLAIFGWIVSLVLAFSIGGVLAAAGIVLSLVYTGAAMSTTAIGTLIPILDDAGELRTRLSTYLLAAGAIGELGPILLITLAFSAGSALDNAIVLGAFAAIAIATAIFAMRATGRGTGLFDRTLESSSHLPVRLTMVLVFLLATLASSMGLDLLLGGFVAGMVVRLVLRGREAEVFESKLRALGYGLLIPMFFLVSGIQLDVSALFADPEQLLRVPMFLVLFLVVRGVPALTLYRRALDKGERVALALFSSTQLPLVVAITTIAVDNGEMHSVTAAALVCAAVLSTACFPMTALALRRRAGRPLTAQ
jgi:Kef-type K+ transport system membrane component KefB